MTGDRPVLTIGVAMKWIPLHVEVDPLSGAVEADPHLGGCSAADRAALEWSLRLAEPVGPFRAEVVAVTAGPPVADALLREAIAAGAARAIRIDLGTDTASDQVAAALASVLASVDIVCCGDHSADRGSGSVPGFIAARLDRAQALGLVRAGFDHDVDGSGEHALVALRRLDHGRRELLQVATPAVLSFEGGTAELRRAGLGAVLAARDVVIAEVPWTGTPDPRVRAEHRSPYRPRPRALAPPDPDLPARDRILALTGAQGAESRARTVVAGTVEAADLVLAQLDDWGYTR